MPLPKQAANTAATNEKRNSGRRKGAKMDRRNFLKGTVVASAVAAAAPTDALTSSMKDKARPGEAGETATPKAGEIIGDPRDGGIFGHWVADEFGLPAYRYELDHVNDPRGTWDTQMTGKSNRHWHQVGNDRITAIAANEGWIQLYSHEYGPRWINMYRPDQQSFAGGSSFLQIGDQMLSTFYRCQPKDAKVERTWGCSYARFSVEQAGLRLERTVFAPFGDSPFLVACVRITNMGKTSQAVTHTEYWDLNLNNVDYLTAYPFGMNQDYRDLTSGRLYAGYAAAYDEGLGALIARHPLAVPTGEDAVNWPAPTVHNRPDVSLAPMGVKPDTFITQRKALFDQLGKYLPKLVEDRAGRPAETENKPTLESKQPVFAAQSQHSIAPGETVVIGYAYGATPAQETESELRNLDRSVERLFETNMRAWSAFVPKVELGDASLERELVWGAYYVRSGGAYHRLYKAHTLPQGGSYQYMGGVNAGPRATLQHAMPLTWLAPEITKDVLRFTLAETAPSGEVPYAEAGTGMIDTTLDWIPSDNDLWLLWAVSDYVLARRDRQFLTDVCSYYPPPYTRAEPVWDHCVRAFHHLTEDIGYGSHGLLRMRTSDWNDTVTFDGKVPMSRIWIEGESTLNSAMGVYVLRRFAELARYACKPAMEKKARGHADKLADAVRTAWKGKFLNRGWLDNKTEIGATDMFLEPQPWALISGVLDEKQQATLVAEIRSRLSDPLGTRIHDNNGGGEEVPSHTFNGIWASINSTLVWGLSKVSPEEARKEHLANTLANHARTYPANWFGIWSGPDVYFNSESKRPGETYTFGPQFSMQGWPVQILFQHSEPLNSALWMMGIEANAEGIAVRPRLPLDRWSWKGSGMSIRFDKERIHGSISGAGTEMIRLTLQLPAPWHGGPIEIEEDGVKRKVDHAGPEATLTLWVAPNTTAEFAVNKG